MHLTLIKRLGLFLKQPQERNGEYGLRMYVNRPVLL